MSREARLTIERREPYEGSIVDEIRREYPLGELGGGLRPPARSPRGPARVLEPDPARDDRVAWRARMQCRVLLLGVLAYCLADVGQWHTWSFGRDGAATATNRERDPRPEQRDQRGQQQDAHHDDQAENDERERPVVATALVTDAPLQFTALLRRLHAYRCGVGGAVVGRPVQCGPRTGDPHGEEQHQPERDGHDSSHESASGVGVHPSPFRTWRAGVVRTVP